MGKDTFRTDAARSELRLGLFQSYPTWEDAAASRARILDLLTQAPELDLLVFPEMCLTGFSILPERTALSPKDHEFFAELARRRKVAVGYCGNMDGKIVFRLLDRDGLEVGSYTKRHLFAPGGEAENYCSGEVAPSRWRWEGWSLLPSICYDLRFPYQFWKDGPATDLILLPANWPTARLPHWQALLVARAIENQCWVVGVNRTGTDIRPRYEGHSMVVAPSGEIVFEADEREGLFVVTLDHARVAAQRNRFPFFADRRE